MFKEEIVPLLYKIFQKLSRSNSAPFLLLSYYYTTIILVLKTPQKSKSTNQYSSQIEMKKILIKYLKIKLNNYVKKIRDLISQMPDWFNIYRSINIIHHV